NSRKFSVAQLLLFVDQHRAFRFIKLHTRAWERLEEQIEKEQKKVPVEKVSGSDEYSQLSVEAKSACDEIEQLCKQGSSFQDPHWKYCPSESFKEMNEVEKMKEMEEPSRISISLLLFRRAM
ncbi:hypothetical protein PMAYCL1PPCAC_25214, partial [Pristionchus mayeri]